MITENHSLKILLVEDEKIPMVVHRKMLTDLGYTPDISEDGQQALAMSHKGYDIIFMDIGLPDIDGLTVAAEIRRREGNIKYSRIIALTGYISDEVQEQCLAVGIDEIATKPISLTKFNELLDRFKNKETE